MTRRDWPAFLLAMLGLCCSLAGGQEPEVENYLFYAPEPFVVFEGLNDERTVGKLIIKIDKDGHYVLREGVVHGACESEVAELKARIAELEKQIRIEMVIPSPEMSEHECRMREECGQEWWCQHGCAYDGCNWTCCDDGGACVSTLMGCGRGEIVYNNLVPSDGMVLTYDFQGPWPKVFDFNGSTSMTLEITP